MVLKIGWGQAVTLNMFRWLVLPFRRSIRNKLMLSMVLIAAVPVMVVTLLAMENVRKSMEYEIIQSNRSRLIWVGQYLDERLQRLNNLIYSILYSPGYVENIEKLDSDSLGQQFAAQTSLMDLLTSTLYSEIDSLSGIELYTMTKHKLFYVSNLQFSITNTDTIPEPWKKMFDNRIDVQIINHPSQPDRFYLMRTINRFEDRSKQGGILLDVKWGMMQNVLDMANPEKESLVYIADGNGNPMYAHRTSSIDPASFVHVLQGVSGAGVVKHGGHYVFYSALESWHLLVVKIIPESQINESANTTGRYGLVIGLASVLVSACVAILIALQTSKPIVKLAKSMQKLNVMKPANLPEHHGKPRIDEIGMLESKFYSMTERLRDHITTEYVLNLQKRTAQLKALQAQINPHFLHNTLQMIGGMALSKSPHDIYQVIRALSDMFRYIVRESDLSTLDKELSHVRNFMVIQEQRFPQKLRFEIDAEPGLASCKIPKLTLQPIVENAVQYGLEPQIDNWHVRITCRKSAENVIITIQDNGVGMPPDQLSALQKRLEANHDPVWENEERIGLRNVNARIKMHFGPQYGVWIESRKDAGTKVTITIPDIKERRDER